MLGDSLAGVRFGKGSGDLATSFGKLTRIARSTLNFRPGGPFSRGRRWLWLLPFGALLAGGLGTHTFGHRIIPILLGVFTGLYIARRALAQHGGELELATYQRQGATFVVSLPMQESA
jgi:hypothetical protein